MSITPRRVAVTSPARLHLGFFDLHGGSDRVFGSLGVAISDLTTRVSVARANDFAVSGLECERAERYAKATIDALGLGAGVDLNIEQTIPAHAGLGSGTQLALAVARALVELNGVRCETAKLAAITARGARSGIGVGVFESGGFIIDGGRGANTIVPPVLARFEFPSQWRIILVRDINHQGLSGSAERAAFESSPPMSQTQAGELCRASLMGVFPALAEADFAGFATAIATIQEIIGAYFGPSQGGQFTSAGVASVMQILHAEFHLEGIGQTSWGPTGFAFVDNELSAEAIVTQLRKRFAEVPSLRFSVHSARNHGAEIDDLANDQRQAGTSGS